MARREGGVWVNDAGEPATIVVNADGTSTLASTVTTLHGKTLAFATVNLTATGTVVSLTGGQSIYVYALRLVSQSTGMAVNWRSGGSTALDAAETYDAHEGYVESVTPPGYLFKTASGESLDLVISGTGTVRGRVSYWKE